MNEILKKRIEEASYEDANGYYPKYFAHHSIRRKGFLAGAEFTLQNQWISVEEALPEVDEEVLVMFPDRSHVVACRKERLTAIGCVTEWRNSDYTYDDAWINYWMPIPKLKKNNNE